MTTDKRKTGVYRIRNLINNKVYVGSAGSSFSQRWKDHRRHLRKGTHHSQYLQNSWAKYGEDAFVFEIVERTAPEHAVAVEQTFIDFWKATDPLYGYNTCPIAGSVLGVRRAAATRIKHTESNLKRYQDPTEREKTSAGQRERWANENARIAQSEALSKHWRKPKVREASSLNAIARLSDQKARQKMSSAAKKRFEDPVKYQQFLDLMTSDKHREKLSIAHQNPSPETRALWSQQRKELWADPVFREKMIAAQTAGHARNRAAKAAALAAQQETPDANP